RAWLPRLRRLRNRLHLREPLTASHQVETDRSGRPDRDAQPSHDSFRRRKRLRLSTYYVRIEFRSFRLPCYRINSSRLSASEGGSERPPRYLARKASAA